jgi:uncharacterized protein YneF (UPF0154 family)
MPVWLVDVLYVLLGVVIGAIAGFFITRRVFKKQLEENPPINEKMIEVMMSGMGRKPSQKQVRQIMNQMNKYK